MLRVLTLSFFLSPLFMAKAQEHASATFQVLRSMEMQEANIKDSSWNFFNRKPPRAGNIHTIPQGSEIQFSKFTENYAWFHVNIPSEQDPETSEQLELKTHLLNLYRGLGNFLSPNGETLGRLEKDKQGWFEVAPRARKSSDTEDKDSVFLFEGATINPNSGIKSLKLGEKINLQKEFFANPPTLLEFLGWWPDPQNPQSDPDRYFIVRSNQNETLKAPRLYALKKRDFAKLVGDPRILHAKFPEYNLGGLPTHSTSLIETYNRQEVLRYQSSSPPAAVVKTAH